MFAVKRGGRNLDRLGTGRDDDVFRFVGLGITVFVGNFDLAAGQQLAVAVNGSHAVGLEQTGDAAGQLLNDTSLAFLHFGDVDFNVFGHNTHGLVVVAGFLKLVSHLQQRLGRDTTHVQAGTAQHLAFAIFAGPGLYTSGFQTLLGSLDRCHVATGAGADDDNVKFVRHNLSCSLIR